MAFPVRLVILQALCLLLAMPAAAHELDNTNAPYCRCHTDAIDGTRYYGEIEFTQGRVYYTDQSGRSRGYSGARLIDGSEVSVGSDSSADISVGQFCKLRLESNTVAYITREANIGDKLCVRVERLAAATKTGILGPWPVLVGVKIGISRLGLPRLGRGGRGASD